MSNQVIPYGGAELKRAMPRYWMYGFAISVVIHLGILAMQQLVKAADPVFPPPQVTGSGDRTAWIDLNPRIPGIVPVLPPSGQEKRVNPVDGIPTPVNNNLVDPDQTIETQRGRALNVEPLAGGNGEGGATGGGIEIPEEAPPPFRAVQHEAEVIRSVLPVYPEVARLSGLEGKVFVKIWVDKEGRCRKVEILSSTADIFNDAAIEAAKQFLFTPAYMNDGPVSVWVAIPFVFRLSGR